MWGSQSAHTDVHWVGLGGCVASREGRDQWRDRVCCRWALAAVGRSGFVWVVCGLVHLETQKYQLVPCWGFFSFFFRLRQLQFDFCLLFGACFCAGLGLFSCHLEAVELFLCSVEALLINWWIWADEAQNQPVLCFSPAAEHSGWGNVVGCPRAGEAGLGAVVEGFYFALLSSFILEAFLVFVKLAVSPSSSDAAVACTCSLPPRSYSWTQLLLGPNCLLTWAFQRRKSLWQQGKLSFQQSETTCRLTAVSGSTRKSRVCWMECLVCWKPNCCRALPSHTIAGCTWEQCMLRSCVLLPSWLSPAHCGQCFSSSFGKSQCLHGWCISEESVCKGAKERMFCVQFGNWALRRLQGVLVVS